jgi:hypothetical protein
MSRKIVGGLVLGVLVAGCGSQEAPLVKRTAVPDVAGMTPAEAYSILRTAGLNSKSTSSGFTGLVVCKTNPAAGSRTADKTVYFESGSRCKAISAAAKAERASLKSTPAERREARERRRREAKEIDREARRIEGRRMCIILANGGNTLCGADAAAWCDSTDEFREGKSKSQRLCDKIRGR